MLSRLQKIPKKWKMSAVFLLVLIHVLPLLFTVYLLWPNERNTLKEISQQPPLSFIQTNSTVSVEKSVNPGQLSPTFKLQLNTRSQTNQTASLRQDMTLLYQDGVLIGKMDHSKHQADVVMQQLEKTSQYNHLFQAISFHYAENQNQTYLYHMSDDYLYVSATKYGGIQTFHQPVTIQQQNWKQIIDRTIHQQLNFEYHDAFHKFKINPNHYFLFPLSQLPLYNYPKQLPGIPAEHAVKIIRKIWDIIHEQIVKESDTKVQESSMPLILVAKDGTSFSLLYRASDGLYHQWDQSVQDVLK